MKAFDPKTNINNDSIVIGNEEEEEEPPIIVGAIESKEEEEEEEEATIKADVPSSRSSISKMQQDKQNAYFSSAGGVADQEKEEHDPVSAMVNGSSTSSTTDQQQRSLGKIYAPVLHHNGEHDVPVLREYFEDEMIEKNQKIISYARKENLSSTEALRSLPRPYLSYLDSASPPNSNRRVNMPAQPRAPPFDEFEGPMPMPTPDNDSQQQEQQRPGAYSDTPGARLHRLDQLNFSLVGMEPPGMVLGQATMIHQEEEEDSDRIGLELVEQGELPNLDNSSNHGALVQASPVGSASFYNSSRRMMRMAAQPVDQEDLVGKQAAWEAKEKKHKRIAYGVVSIAFLVLLVSLAVRLLATKDKDESNDSAGAVVVDTTTEAPTPSPTSRPLPPMDTLELLYHELPQGTKESLYNHNSPQYQAWEWLLHHPNVTTYPEWRKKQLFAMATFFLTLDGPNWSESTPGYNRWMNVITSECSWVLSDEEAIGWAHQSNVVLGPDAYQPQDFQACNQDRELQALFVSQLTLPAPASNTHGKQLSFPPEIGMLTSLKILGIGWSAINAELSDLLIPEVTGLPRLEMLVFQQSGVSGTIPHEVSQLTDLRHLLIGANNLYGTLPTELAKMTSLEHISLDNMEGIIGELPSDLGLMTSLTSLEIDRNSFWGRIPSELGLVNKMSRLALFENRLTGSLPTEFGLMTDAARLRIWNTGLTGQLPTELGLMTNLVELRLGNDLKGESPNNSFSGSLPTELWGLTHMEELFLSNLPNLRGKVPSTIMMPNLTMLNLKGSSQVSGTIPDQVCLFVDDLDFDCSDLLCGCECHCSERVNRTNGHA